MLVHGGFTNGAEAWAGQAPLADAFELVVVDRSGHGRASADGRRAPAAQAEDVAALLGDDAHLVGHSYGRLIAMLAAARRPDAVRSLCLLEPPAFSLVRGDADVERFVDRLHDAYAGRDDRPPLATRNAFFGAFGLSPRRVPLSAQEARDVEASRREQPPWEVAVPSGLAGPVLALTGTWPAPPPGVVADGAAYGTARRALRAVCEALAEAGARRAELAGAGHRVQGARGFNAALRRFLAGA